MKLCGQGGIIFVFGTVCKADVDTFDNANIKDHNYVAEFLGRYKLNISIYLIPIFFIL